MTLIATGLTGTIGRKMDGSIHPARVVLGSTRLRDHFKIDKGSMTLVHLAGVVGESKVTENLGYSERINVDETFNLAREVIEDFGGRFIHISSSHIYGPTTTAVTEDSLPNPQTHYASQKHIVEQKLNNYFGVENPQLVILRVFSVLGWDVEEFTLGGLVKRIMKGSKEVVSNSDDIRDFMTPTSIARAISTIAKNGQVSGVFNLSTGTGIKVGDAVRSMFKVSNFQEPTNQINPGKSKASFIVGDNQKLLNTGLSLELIWNPINDLPKNFTNLRKSETT